MNKKSGTSKDVDVVEIDHSGTATASPDGSVKKYEAAAAAKARPREGHNIAVKKNRKGITFEKLFGP